MRERSAATLGLPVVLALGVAACAAGPASTADAVRSNPLPSPTTLSPSESAIACPHRNGGQCRGELAEGTYTTTTFETPLTYTVPAGWENAEDLPGNFLLIPEGASVDLLEAGTIDFIGVYDGVAAASADCAEEPQDGLESTPNAIADWYGSLEGLDITERQPVTLGGLDGVVLDIRLAEGTSMAARIRDTRASRWCR